MMRGAHAPAASDQEATAAMAQVLIMNFLVVITAKKSAIGILVNLP
jgi:hypothetical protein